MPPISNPTLRLLPISQRGAFSMKKIEQALPAFIDGPKLSDTLETWECHLRKLERLPAETPLREGLIESAHRMIELKKARRHLGRD
jgi:hypothetical protein